MQMFTTVTDSWELGRVVCWLSVIMGFLGPLMTPRNPRLGNEICLIRHLTTSGCNFISTRFEQEIYKETADVIYTT